MANKTIPTSPLDTILYDIEGIHVEQISLSDEEVRVYAPGPSHIPDPQLFLPNKLPTSLEGAFFNLMPPVFLKSGNTYTPVARCWALDLILRHNIEIFRAIVVSDKKLVPLIAEYETIELSWLTGRSTENEHPNDNETAAYHDDPKSQEDTIPLSEPVMEKETAVIEPQSVIPESTSPADARSRQQAKEVGRTCLFCSGGLARKSGKEGKTGKGNRILSCSYRDIKLYKCKFQVPIIEEELTRFKTLNISSMIKKNDDLACRDCGDITYTRTVTTAKGVKKYHCCRKYFYNDTPDFAAHEFRTNPSYLSLKELCDEVAKWPLPEDLRNRKTKNLAWLNEVLMLPMPYVIMTGGKAQKGTSAKFGELLRTTANFRQGQNNTLTEQVIQDTIKLNRYTMERKIDRCPRLYKDNITICNCIEEVV